MSLAPDKQNSLSLKCWAMWRYHVFSDQTGDKDTSVRSATESHMAPILEQCREHTLLFQAVAHRFHCRAHHSVNHCTPATENQQTLLQQEYLAVYGCASMGKSWLLDYYRFAFRVLAAVLLTMPNFVATVEKMPEISAIEYLCSRKNGPKFTKIA